MPSFSRVSMDKLATCHPKLQEVFKAVVEHFDCTVLEGHRGQVAQDKAFAEGYSKLKWPKGKHNSLPSLAVDVAPYPIDWKDVQRFHYFGGYVMGIAARMGVPLRWGGDWNRNTQMNDETFRDLVHFELREGA